MDFDYTKTIVNIMTYFYKRNQLLGHKSKDEFMAHHAKRHQVLVTIIVEKDPTLDMHLSTKRESYHLKVERSVHQIEPRDNVHITIR